jgi:hypothetical protein
MKHGIGGATGYTPLTLLLMINWCGARRLRRFTIRKPAGQSISLRLLTR